MPWTYPSFKSPPWVLIGSAPAREEFLAKHAAHVLTPDERVRALSMMEMARHAMLMYTSCGWFFDELSGIETVQCMQYAARVAELLHEVGGHPTESDFVERLSAAQSNIPEEGDGRNVCSDATVTNGGSPAGALFGFTLLLWQHGHGNVGLTMAGGEVWSVPQWDKEEAPAILLWYHGRSMVVPYCYQCAPRAARGVLDSWNWLALEHAS